MTSTRPPGNHNDSDAPRRGDRAVALAALALTGDRGDDCPDLERLVAWHERRLDAQQAKTVQTHVAACDRCFALWGELRALAAEDPRTAPARHRDRQGWWQTLLTGSGYRGQLGAVGAAVALVAVVGLYLSVQTPGSLGPPLPGYDLTLQGQSAFRGTEPTASPERVAFANGTRFELLLRPETTIPEQIDARVWWIGQDGPRALPVEPSVANRGLLLIDGEVGTDWVLPPGDAELLVVVGRTGSLPDARALLRRLDTARRLDTDDWDAWRIGIRVAQ
jgi:hypothetical protein